MTDNSRKFISLQTEQNNLLREKVMNGADNQKEIDSISAEMKIVFDSLSDEECEWVVSKSPEEILSSRAFLVGD